MIRVLFILINLFLFAPISMVSAQSVSQIGFGTSAPLTNNSIYSPICRFSATSGNDCSRSNLLYTSAELSTAGITSGTVISKIAFYKIGTGASTAGFNFEIHMRNSTTSAPLTATTWATILTTHTPVYTTSTQTIPATAGWIEFTLTTPFVYTGQNLEIAMSHSMTAIPGSPSTGPFDWQYTSGFQDYIIGQVSSSLPANLNGTVVNYKVRPNIQIHHSSPLPVKLLSFRGEELDHVNKLIWETTAEAEYVRFEVERSIDGETYSNLGFVASNQQVRQATGVMIYSFEDSHPADGKNYYRLRQVNRDNSSELSKIVAISRSRISQVPILSVYPNPAKDVLGLQIESRTDERAVILIADVTGKSMFKESVTLRRGYQRLVLPISHLPATSYIATICFAHGLQSSVRFIISR